MKIKEGFMLREVAGQFMVVAVGELSKEFNGIIRLNGVGKYLWENMQNETTADELLNKVTAEYDVDEATAKKDIDNFIEKLKEADILA